MARWMLLCLFAGAGLRGADADRELADHLLAKTGISRGFCSILGSRTGALAREILGGDAFFIHLQDPDRESLARTREILGGTGLYGVRAVADGGSPGRLPYADAMVDLLIARLEPGPNALDALSPAEILRVLRPGAKAIISRERAPQGGISPADWRKWLETAGAAEQAIFGEDRLGTWGVITKPPARGTDSWSHWEHGPDNNPVSTDTVIRAPYRTQWIGGPLYSSMPVITTAAGGRIFTAMGHIAHHEREEVWLNTLIARNGYNGTMLWSRKLPDAYLVHRSAFVATPDVFYMIDGDGCLLLDPETGRTIDRIQIPGVEGEWKYAALQAGVLYVLAGAEKDPAEITLVRSARSHWSWGELSKGYYGQTIPWGFGSTIAAFDVARKALRWRHDEDRPIDSRAIVLGGGKLFFYSPGAYTGCLDATTGAPVWKNADQEVTRLIEEPGRGLASTPGFRTTCYALYTPDVVFFQAQTRMNVVAVSTRDGRLLWTRKKTTNNPNLLFADDQLLAGIGPGGRTLVLDPSTGETIKDLGFAKRSCARLTATPDSFFCRGWPEGLTRYDRATGKVLFNGALRPACNDGVIAANGLLYIGPWLCDCNLSLMGTNALCSAGDFSCEVEDPVRERLETFGAADGPDAPFPEATPADWPLYRGGATRAAGSPVSIAEKPQLGWVFQPPRVYVPSAPSACGDFVFVGGDDGRVRAIDARTGALAWSAATSGPITTPPAIWGGRAYAGSSDGFVYAFSAATGKLLWRFRVAPVERRIMVHDRLCSSWPILHGLLVHEGVVYAAAGIIDYDGTSVVALDAASGEPRWRNTTAGHIDKELRKGVSAHGVVTIAQDRLWMPGGNVVCPAVFDSATGACLSRDVGNGSPRANRGEEVGVLADRFLIFGGRLAYSAVRNVVNPGSFAIARIRNGQLGRTAPLGSGKIPPAWTSNEIVMADGPRSVPTCAEVSALEDYIENAGTAAARRQAGDQRRRLRRWTAQELAGSDPVAFAIAAGVALVVMETPQPRSEPSLWQLAGLDLQTGAVRWKLSLPGAARPGALAVDRAGRMIVALEDGRIACVR